MEKQLLSKAILLTVHFNNGEFKNYLLSKRHCCFYGFAKKQVVEYEVGDHTPHWALKPYKKFPFTKTLTYIEFEDCREVDEIKITTDKIKYLTVSEELYPCDNATLSDVLKRLPAEQAVEYLKDNEISIKL